MFFLESLPFVFSSLIILFVSFNQISTRTQQQAIAVLLILFLLLLARIPKLKNSIQKIGRLLLIFTSSLIVQLLVFSSGSFFSPFLIVLHLYTLGTSLLLNLTSSVTFLILSVIILIVDIRVNTKTFAIFRDDPWSVILYLISFVVVIPLAQILISTYHLKDKLAKKLDEYLQIAESRQESILRGLNELVLVTDPYLKIISASEAIEKVTNLSPQEVIGHQFLEAVHLESKDGQLAQRNALSVDQLLADKTARIVKDLYFRVKDRNSPVQVALQARPIMDAKGRVSQIVFVMTDAESEEKQKRHVGLEQAWNKQRALTEDLKQQLANQLDTQLKLYILSKLEEDINLTQELEDHSVTKQANFTDVALLCKKIVEGKQELAKDLSVKLQFILPPEEVSEASYIHLTETQPHLTTQTVSDFSAPVDLKWFTILVSRLLDICLFLASSEEDSFVELKPSREGLELVHINILGSSPEIEPRLLEDILSRYFGKLGLQTNLRLSSGLEGYIAKTISSELNIPLEIKMQTQPAKISINLKLTKVPQVTG